MTDQPFALAEDLDSFFGEDAMNLRICGVLAITVSAVSCLLGSTQSLAQNAYITNSDSNNVSVIDTANNTVIATIPVGTFPQGVAVSPDGRKVYVANESSNYVSVIDTAKNKVTATIPVGIEPPGVAVSPDSRKVYVTNFGFQSKSVSVIDTAKNKVTATIPVGIGPVGVAVSPDGRKVYVANYDSATVSVITTKTNKVTATIPVRVGKSPVVEVAVSPDGGKVYVTTPASNAVAVIDTARNKVIATISVGRGPIGVAGFDGSRHDGDQLDVEHRRLNKVYVANAASDNVSVIDTAKNTVIATIPVGKRPAALGLFIQPEQPAPRFAGTPGSSCYVQSVSALVRQFHGLNAAAAALEFSGVEKLQDAISEFCEA
jgi:YVTN family beta-propeller protein